MSVEHTSSCCAVVYVQTPARPPLHPMTQARVALVPTGYPQPQPFFYSPPHIMTRAPASHSQPQPSSGGFYPQATAHQVCCRAVHTCRLSYSWAVGRGPSGIARLVRNTESYVGAP
jgi:hypothetical protein